MRDRRAYTRREITTAVDEALALRRKAGFGSEPTHIFVNANTMAKLQKARILSSRRAVVANFYVVPEGHLLLYARGEDTQALISSGTMVQIRPANRPAKTKPIKIVKRTGAIYSDYDPEAGF